MTYQLHQLAGDITAGLSEESCRMIDRWLSIPASEPTRTHTGSVSHQNLKRPRSTTSEALSLARELMTLATTEGTAGATTCARQVRFMTRALLVIVDRSVTTYESSREDDRLLSDVLGMGAIRILCFDNASRTAVFVFTDSHLISRAEARALLELAQ
ncbi:hypothetical protein [Deinococcus sedimenti]|uniref:Uncharacterized protein n=1 Tax=Deinococcus sedimenti TaxID=1867090 RepID=A0ABQ2S0B8_9DEIO|nr:hypothetical protein [Deinococcus sedimenti]GGR84699.1 hypothetical protein GCM10008960_09660 [Deinococcus sedimenti]